jgi:hypothetical protein
MEDTMPMLFWLPMIILSGIWSIAVDAARTDAAPMEIKQAHASRRRSERRSRPRGS